MNGRTGWSLPDPMSAEAVFVVDAEQNVVAWNHEAARLFGRDAESAVGGLCYQLVGAWDERGHRFCRPDCPVITAASRGKPLPPLRLQAPTAADGGLALQVSTILFSSGDRVGSVVHLCRPVRPRKAPSNQQSAPVRLTRRERQILARFCAGTTSSEAIAGELGIAPVTVRNEVQRLLEKLAVHSRAEAVALAYREKLLP